jgi:glycosyltransferase involved in cell wall biosynthesis
MNKLADSIIIADSLYEKYIRRKSVVKYLKIPSNIPPLFLSEAERINLRKQYGIEKSQILLGYFGKIFQEKNFEAIIQLLVQITDSKLLYIGQMTGNKYLLEKITNMIIKFNLTERIVETGYLSTVDVAKCLNIVDVYVCLFASGVSPKNASFTAAVSQGIFVVTTSTEKQGYSDNENVFYLTPPGNVNVIMDAINTYGMKRIVPDCGLCPRWADIAEQHLQIYLQLAGAL